MSHLIRRRQAGVAVVTALLLTTLAITIVASLFWQQQVQVRSIENQRFQLQKKWVLRGALDWAGLILREDKRIGKVDHLGEPWAVNLGDTRLDQYVENGRTEVEDSEATLSGQISDAQAKFNLTNLAANGKVDLRELAAFSKLLSNLRLDPALAQQVAVQIAMTQERLKEGPDDPGSPPVSPNLTVQFLKFSQIEDLLAVPGFNATTIARLRNFVTVLPRYTKINVNTTTAEVLSARLESVSLSDAALMIATRDRISSFRDFADFRLNFSDKVKETDTDLLDFQTNFFMVNGRVKLNRSLLEVDALFERDEIGTKILWIKEN